MFRPSLHSHCSPIPAAALLAATVLALLFSTALSKTLFIPFDSSLDPAGFQDPANASMRQAKNEHVLVEGGEVPVSYAELALSSQERVVAAEFAVDFPADGETTIQVRYDLRAVHEPKSPLLSYRYLMQTGSHWAGTIGSGQVRFDFWRPVADLAAFDRVNDVFTVSDGSLVLSFSDLEPDPSHDLALTFDPTRFGGGENATTPSTPETLTVRAFVDGRSRLVITGDEAYWHHLDFAAPGRWSDPAYTQPHDEPTYLNGVPWYPVWPNRLDRENRDCDCYSSSTSGFPQLTQPGWEATVDVEQGRGRVTIVRQPEAANDYALVVEFDDNDWDGADWYEVTLGSAAAAPPAGVPATPGPTVTRPRSAPAAHGQLVTTPQDTPVDITLTASHPDDMPLTFALVDVPSHGILAGTAPSLVYLPQAGYAGSDAFTFRAGDGEHDSGVAAVSLIVGLPPGPSGGCTGPNMLRNGDFEEGFDGQGVGHSWGSFHTAGGAVYAFQDDRWSPVVCGGSHSQLLGIGTANVPPAANRFAGIYQRVTGLETGALYELSIAGLVREEAAHLEDSHRYQVQWAYSSQGHQDWTQAAGWQDLPWSEISLRTDPGAFSTYTTRLVAPSEPLTLYLRAWKKWATSGRELDVNLDAISLRRCASDP